MAFTRTRKRPTAFLRSDPGRRCQPGRIIILSTGRGDVLLDAAEALDLAAELTREAAAARVRLAALAKDAQAAIDAA